MQDMTDDDQAQGRQIRAGPRSSCAFDTAEFEADYYGARRNTSICLTANYSRKDIWKGASINEARKEARAGDGACCILPPKQTNWRSPQGCGLFF